jgi:ArsR family transcriptional regulator
MFGDTFFLWGLLGLIDPSLVVGDLGCGTGQLAEALAPCVRRVVAVDGSDEMLTAARSRLEGMANVELRQGDLESLPLSNGELDAALLSLVLHYAPDPARVLGETSRVVRTGGRVLVVDMLPHEHEEYQQQMGHVWLGFSEKYITRVLTSAGFEHVRVRLIPADPSANGPALFAAVGVKH